MPLSSAFLHQALLIDLYIQTYQALTLAEPPHALSVAEPSDRLSQIRYSTAFHLSSNATNQEFMTPVNLFGFVELFY